MLSPEANTELSKISNDFILEKDQERKNEAENMKIEIASADHNTLMRMMRSGYDPVLRQDIIKRAHELGDDFIMEIIEKFQKSRSDVFIDSAARILATCNSDISNKIINFYDDMKSPYAQSVALVILGFKGKEKDIRWLIEKHKEMIHLYPDKQFHEGAYYALYELEYRLYSE